MARAASGSLTPALTRTVALALAPLDAVDAPERTPLRPRRPAGFPVRRACGYHLIDGVQAVTGLTGIAHHHPDIAAIARQALDFLAEKGLPDLIGHIRQGKAERLCVGTQGSGAARQRPSARLSTTS